MLANRPVRRSARRESLVGRLCVGVALALSCSTLVVSSAGADGLTSAELATQSALSTYLTNLAGAVQSAAANPQIGSAVSPDVANYLSSLSSASAQVSQLSGPELDVIGGILGQNTSWQTQPSLLQSSLSGMSSAAPSTTPPPGVLSNCQESLGDQRSLFYAYWAAAQVASAANAVASGMPDGADFAAGTIIAGIAFGVANGIAIALGAELSLAQDCAAAVSNQALVDAYPMYNGSVTPASSQASVDTLTQISQGIEQTLTTIQTNIATLTSSLSSTINVLAGAQGIADDLQSAATSLQGTTDDLLNAVGSATDSQGATCADSATTANGQANIINTCQNTILQSTSTLQDLSLRIEIERTLAAVTAPVALFERAGPDGYLGTVAAIVKSTVNNELAAGMSVGQAQADLANADAAYAAGQWATAYQDYQAAYTQATK